jgi:hypothetical protein
VRPVNVFGRVNNSNILVISLDILVILLKYNEDKTLYHSEAKLIAFCSVARTRAELSAFLNISSVSYMMEKYINPLLESGKLKMTIPDKPKSRNQKYFSE